MPTLSACLIVKNEEKFLEQCLQSIKDLADEIIIVDTGSTDRTKEIAQRFTNKVYDFPWCNDFSAARNQSLKYAVGEWILVLDADETISQEDHHKIKELIINAAKEVSGFVLTQRNYLQSENDLQFGSVSGMKIKGTAQGESGLVPSKNDSYSESKNTAGWLPTPIVRLFRNEPKIAFSGVVHEDVSPSLAGRIISTSILFHHYGKLSLESWKQKWAVYEQLGERKLQQEQDYYNYFELGRQYLENKKINLAQEMFQKSIELKKDFWLSWFNLGSIYLIKNELDAAITNLEKAKEINPNVSLIYSNLGVAYVKNKKHQKAVANFLEAVKLNPEDAGAYKNLGFCFDEIGDKDNAYLALKKAVELNPELKRIIQIG